MTDLPNARRWKSASLMAALIVLLGFSQNCTQSTMNDNTSAVLAARAQSFFQATGRFEVAVFYEPSAQPFISGAGGSYWDILEINLQAIFQYRSTPPSLVVPKTLSEMTALPASGRSLWSIDDILALHAAHPAPTPAPSAANFEVYFLDGYFSENGQAQTGVIGVNITGTSIVAIFKRVVESTGYNPAGLVPKYVEQSTLVHELGHALGFVNNGVPMVEAHQDVAHGAHSTDTECVMYWANEGVSNMTAFVQKYLATSSKVMWGRQVLQDAQAISR